MAYGMRVCAYIRTFRGIDDGNLSQCVRENESAARHCEGARRRRYAAGVERKPGPYAGMPQLTELLVRAASHNIARASVAVEVKHKVQVTDYGISVLKSKVR